MSCTGKKQWYVCNAGNFRGCCGMDPCTSGICTDDDTSSVVSLVSTTSTASGASESRTVISSTTQSTTEDVASSTSIASLSTLLTTTGTHTTNFATPTSTSTSTSTNTPGHSSNIGRIAGGIIGAIAGLAICGALFIFWWRRKRRKLNVNLHQSVSVSSRSFQKREVSSSAKTGSAGDDIWPLSSNDGHELELFVPSGHDFDSVGISTISATRSHPGTHVHNGAPSNLSLTIPASNSTPSLSSIHAATKDSSRRPNRVPMEIPASSRPSLTPELYDTGFYRQRAELAEQSQRELINIPYEQRRRNPRSQNRKLGASRNSTPASAISSETASPMLTRGKTARRVLTIDGVVLGATLDSHGNARERHPNPNRQNTGIHVLSFMDYEPETRARVKSSNNTSVAVGQAVLTVPSLERNSFSPLDDIPPAYDAGASVSSGRDGKFPSGTLEHASRRSE